MKNYVSDVLMLFLSILLLVTSACKIPTDKKISSTSTSSNVDLHQFVSGVWVDAEEYYQIKNGDLTEPHPFQRSITPIHTCIKDDGKFFFGNGATWEGKGDRLDDDYLMYDGPKSEKSRKYSLRFNSTNGDTTMQLTLYDGRKFVLHKTPKAKACTYPSIGGIRDVYNHYFFKGNYLVENSENKMINKVSIQQDLSITGIPDVEYIYATTGASHLMVNFNNMKGKTSTYYVVKVKDYGFDLHACDQTAKRSVKGSRIKIDELVYKFKKVK